MRCRQHPLVAQYDASAVEHTVPVERDQPRPGARIAGGASDHPRIFRPGETRRGVAQRFRVRAPSHPVGVDVFVKL